METSLQVELHGSKLLLKFLGELTVYNLSNLEKKIDRLDLSKFTQVDFDLLHLDYIDSAVALFIDQILQKLENQNTSYQLQLQNETIQATLNLVKSKRLEIKKEFTPRKTTVYERLGKRGYHYYTSLLNFVSFLGKVFVSFMLYLKKPHKIRYKEIFFEINESGVKAVMIIALTSFLVGLVVAYQAAYQLKIYGGNIFIVDMLGISILRELAPLITAIVIAGRSGSAYTAQIGAMKITQEIDAMRTMGFEPFAFLVLPRIIALSIAMPLLIFVADMMGMLGGVLVASLDLKITMELFLERFHEVIAAKHFFVGIFKGPFFAFLIASIAIYRGLIVKDDTQSIGFNTTKSVVEAIFAVIVCDAIFSIAFTNLGI
ncbi:ABC transporter permease [Sulfurimonas marina]|uniref:MlaE family lipid ABC transporter permease subunit n=1 Tax=Sulfurimonas marina TaxID=2590551 RepID=A0A7M1AWB1_9BACT|nr:MlaE family lipid ABC transporter permease subunit [Sulfurimonas marina]QOP41743.1 MlaE family lipid ABC transporter permease subunit [Sulfurimonas marina]